MCTLVLLVKVFSGSYPRISKSSFTYFDLPFFFDYNKVPFVLLKPSWNKLGERLFCTPWAGWLGRAEPRQDTALNHISSRTCKTGAEWGGTLAGEALGTTVTVYPLLAGTLPSCVWCVPEMRMASGAEIKKWEYRDQKNLCDLSQDCSQYRREGLANFSMSPNLTVLFFLVFGNFVYS